MRKVSITCCLLSFFTVLPSLTLQEAFTYALEQAPDVQSSVAARTIQQAEVSKKMGAFCPNVTAEFNLVHDHFNRIDPSSTDAPTNLWRRDYSIQATQSIFDGLSRYHELKGSQRLLLAYIQSTKDHSLGLLGSVASSYFKVMMSEEIVQLAKENFKNIKEIADLIEIRVAQGLSKEVDKVQASGRLALARANILETINELHRARAYFRSLTGGLDALNLETPNLTILKEDSYQSFWGRVQDYNARLKQYAYLQDVAYHNYQSSKGVFFPRVDGVGRYEMRKNIDGNPVSLENIQLGVRVAYNIFRGSQDLQQVYEQAQKYQQTKYEYKKQLLDLEYQANSLWASYQSVNDSLSFYAQHVQATQQITKAYKDQFLLGQRSLLDLLDAHNEWHRSLNNLARHQCHQRISSVEMAALSGQILFLLADGTKADGTIFLTPEQAEQMTHLSLDVPAQTL